jgi:glucose-1-phosphate cytidylyltransferase
LATITGVVPPGRYGAIVNEGDAVKSFEEKPQGDGAIINGGFFVLSPSVIDLIDNDETSWELEPLLKLVS